MKKQDGPGHVIVATVTTFNQDEKDSIIRELRRDLDGTVKTSEALRSQLAEAVALLRRVCKTTRDGNDWQAANAFLDTALATKGGAE